MRTIQINKNELVSALTELLTHTGSAEWMVEENLALPDSIDVYGADEIECWNFELV